MTLEQRLAAWCLERRRAGERVVIGLNGPVGAGKSTFSRQLQHHCRALGLDLAIASIDDAYLPWQARITAMAGNPFGVNRVPPGSHDPEALVAPIRRWRSATEARLELPRFSKTLREGAGDRVEPWQGPADALLLEGWLLGCRPVPERMLKTRLQAAEQLSAAERQWVLRCNSSLNAYQPLWDQLDQLVVFWPLRWNLPHRWRLQAEARQRRSGGGWMQPAAVEALVQASLRSLPPDHFQEDVAIRADAVRVLDGRRRVVWEGGGGAALRWLAQLQSSVSSSATG